MNKPSFDIYRDAVLLCEHRDYAGFDGEYSPEEKHVFTQSFTGTIKRLADDVERRAVRRRAARILIAAALIGLLTLLSILGAGAIREGKYFFKGVTHTAETAFSETDELTDTRLPSYIPEGYEPYYSISDFNMYQKTWARAGGGQITFIQQRYQNIMYDFYDGDSACPVYIDTVVEGDTVYYISEYQSGIMVTWCIGAEPDPMSHFLLFGNISPDEAVKMAESVRLVDKKYNSVIFTAEKDGEQLIGHDRIEGLYELSAPPGDLVFDNELGRDIHHYHINYCNDKGETLGLRQLPIRYTSMEFDTQRHTMHTVTRNGIDYTFFVSDQHGWNSAFVVWVRYGYIFEMQTCALEGSKTFSEEALIEAAESLRYAGEYDWSGDIFIPEPVSRSDVSQSDVIP